MPPEWQIEFNELKLGPTIGSGAYGIVHSGIWRNTDVAIKRFTLVQLSAEALEEFKSETLLMSKLRHRNVVLFLGACLRPPNLCVVTERLDRSVRDLLQDSKVYLSFSDVLKMALEAAAGLHYLHSHTPAIVHRDMKSSNLLVDKYFNIRVCDFGLARFKLENQKTKTFCGTTFWVYVSL